jgi:hypothetical protein
MNKILVLILIMLVVSASYGVQGTAAKTVFTNTATITGKYVPTQSSNVIFTVGSFYGLSSIYSFSNVYHGAPNYQIKIPLYITNLGNDADSNASINLQFISNNAGYVGSNWTYYIEASASNQGTNYNIPFTNFGEGAIITNLFAVVNIPLYCSVNSIGFFKVLGATLSNTGHIAAAYTGFNGLAYGGLAAVSNNLEIDVMVPNSVLSVIASDGVDTITKFDGSAGLRKAKNTITIELQNQPMFTNGVRLWFAVNSLADGSGGANSADKAVSMKNTAPKEYQGEIPESELENGNYLTFLVEVDTLNYLTNSAYKLLDLSKQGNYDTILMHNVMPYNSVENIFIKLPEKLIGKNGKVYLYSVSGDLVKVIFEGTLNDQVLAWDGKDKAGGTTAKGMYFIVVDFDATKEVRKVFIK